MIHFPSRDTAMLQTQLPASIGAPTSMPSSTRQRRIFPSLSPLTTCFPSTRNATDHILPRPSHERQHGERTFPAPHTAIDGKPRIRNKENSHENEITRRFYHDALRAACKITFRLLYVDRSTNAIDQLRQRRFFPNLSYDQTVCHDGSIPRMCHWF